MHNLMLGDLFGGHFGRPGNIYIPVGGGQRIVMPYGLPVLIGLNRAVRNRYVHTVPAQHIRRLCRPRIHILPSSRKAKQGLAMLL